MGSPLAAAGPRGAAVLVLLLLGRLALCLAVEGKKGKGGAGVPPPLAGPSRGSGSRGCAASRGDRRRESPEYFFL